MSKKKEPYNVWGKTLAGKTGTKSQKKEKVSNQNLLVLLHTYTFITNMEGNVYISFIYICIHTQREIYIR